MSESKAKTEYVFIISKRVAKYCRIIARMLSEKTVRSSLVLKDERLKHGWIHSPSRQQRFNRLSKNERISIENVGAVR